MPTLPFTMQHQEESEWCWSAVTTSIDHHFDASSTRTQCQTVSEERRMKCCDSTFRRDPKVCNIPNTVHEPLRRLGWLDAEPLLRPLSFAEIRSEIDKQRPVAVFIRWRMRDGTLGTRGHFFVITGYDAAVGDVMIEDSLFFGSRLSHARVASQAAGDGYQDGRGVWFASIVLRRTRGRLSRATPRT